MIEFEIPESVKTIARAYEKKILENLPDRKNYTGIEASDRYYHGFLGELMFQILLIGHQKDFGYRIRASGQRETCEFTVFGSKPESVGVSLDVKATTVEGLMHITNPNPHECAQFYVDCFLPDKDNTCQFFGYITRYQVLKKLFEKDFSTASGRLKIPALVWRRPVDLFSMDDLLKKIV